MALRGRVALIGLLCSLPLAASGDVPWRADPPAPVTTPMTDSGLRLQADFRRAHVATDPYTGRVKPTLVKPGPRFNLPYGSTEQRGAIDLHIKKLIRNTPKGGEINVALFRLKKGGMAKELAAAHTRGAKVRIVLDHDSLTEGRKTYDYLRARLGGSRSARSWVVVCPKGSGCIAPKVSGVWAKNHNKFYLFSHTYDSRNVTVQTSGNATGGMYGQWNDSYTLSDVGIYRAYRQYFYDLAAQRPDADYFRLVASGNKSAMFFPKAGGDPIVDALDDVDCTAGTRVRLSTGIFTRSAIARRLWRLDDVGCDVRVVAHTIGDTVLTEMTRPGHGNGGPAMRYYTKSQTYYSHAKYLLIDGTFRGGRRQVVLTGSHSYTPSALRYNDEALIMLLGEPGALAAYLKNWEAVYGRAGGNVQMRPPVLDTVLPEPPSVPTVPDDTSEIDEGPAADEVPEAELPPAAG